VVIGHIDKRSPADLLQRGAPAPDDGDDRPMVWDLIG
jgi:hypothetical protein